MPSPNMAAFCARPLSFLLSVYSNESVAMAAVIPASRRLRNLLTCRLTARTNLGLSLNLHPLSSFAQDEPSKAAPEEAPGHSYESLRVTSAQKHILHVQLNRPEKRNAMNKAFWSEMVVCFNKIAEDADCRAVVISGAGKMFTSEISPWDFPGGPVVKTARFHSRRHGFIPGRGTRTLYAARCSKNKRKEISPTEHDRIIGSKVRVFILNLWP